MSSVLGLPHPLQPWSLWDGAAGNTPRHPGTFGFGKWIHHPGWNGLGDPPRYTLLDAVLPYAARVAVQLSQVDFSPEAGPFVVTRVLQWRGDVEVTDGASPGFMETWPDFSAPGRSFPVGSGRVRVEAICGEPGPLDIGGGIAFGQSEVVPRGDLRVLVANEVASFPASLVPHFTEGLELTVTGGATVSYLIGNFSPIPFTITPASGTIVLPYFGDFFIVAGPVGASLFIRWLTRI